MRRFGNMRRLQNTKRVSWASDVSLCQIKFFLSEKTPSQVELGTDHLQKKALGDNEAEDNCPPGFGQIHPANLWGKKMAQLPLIRWRRPLRFEVNNEWEVVAGKESKEMEAQSQREMSVLEAIYPRPSSIPPNPCGLLNVESSTDDDRKTPLVVPLTPIDEDDAAPLDTSLNSPTPVSQSQTSQAALTSILNSGLGNLVDRDLLIKILSNPKMVEQIASSHHASSSAQSGPSTRLQNSITQNGPSTILQNSSTQNGPSTRIQNKPPNVTQYIPPSLRPPTNNAHMTKVIPNGSFYPPPTTQIRPPASPLMKKDINYYKSLIQQHGIEKQDGSHKSPGQNLNLVNGIERQDGSLASPGQNLNLVNCRESKQRIMRPCIYYNSPKGCRNGTNCTYQHDMSSRNVVHGFLEVHNAKSISSRSGVHGFPEVHNAKRFKMDRDRLLVDR